ncbi:MAG TPA: RluA family pseudouridine synthase [Paludibacteraceae bacterium]|nr:RluA family pseudouridine synthase [Paludibacteraceae bacterium]HPT43491.1 RluA family pseudouridine synthase [Paludibacteraceae bacterium]
MRRKSTYTPPPKMTRLKVSEQSLLMDFLLAKMGGMSRSSVKSLLAHRQVTVNDKVVTQFDYTLKKNDSVIINSTRGNVELVHPKLRVIFEDSDLIVVEKKEGLLSVTTGRETETTAFLILKNYVKKSSPRNKIYTVHRLDRETSGILVFAKNSDAQHILRDNWHEIVTRRIYVAVVEGKVTKEKDRIVSWLTENEVSLKISSSKTDNGGKEAITNYRVIKSNEEYSLLEIELETGRKNQIRVHMESIGHPIAGDRKYGSTSGFGRLALHARILEFYHPMTSEVMHFETPVPKEFLKVFRNQ